MAAIWIPKRLVELSLINTRASSKHKFVRHCEFEYESRLYTAAREIIDDDKRVVLISGPSSSGKTTSAYKLRDKLVNLGKNVQVVSMDNFYRNLDDYPRLPDGRKDYENVTALQVDLFGECVNELLEKGEAMFPKFDFATETRTDTVEKIETGDDGILIVEGIHALNPLILDLLPEDKRVTIYAGIREEYSHRGQIVLPSRDVRMIRRMIRDYRHRGHTPAQTIDMWPRVCEGEDTYIKPFKPNADILLDTSFSYEILVMNSVLKNFTEFADETEEGRRLAGILEVFDNLDRLPAGYIPKNSMLVEFYG